MDLIVGKFNLEIYEAIFMNKLTIAVSYNNEICYGVQSMKLNDYNTNCIYYGS